ncbi:beta-lactamase/transpeptidase-like protein [Lasiosphaeris hirsuta]|uniref:Beta-lactamase/transpeptidase-like protein n=1 Tax=Lasiosphaeris hirsuta TaxID=260670 RepID=A0AA40B068_9PEZI|nr:beta-lactamase/transpeptidase-like protein [Lasiosphaeris hirsuta]
MLFASAILFFCSQTDGLAYQGLQLPISANNMKLSTSVVDEFSLGFSDRDKQLIADLNTRYPLGSLTKAFVATTVSELVHEGLLEWDKPVTAYIPELQFTADPALADRLALIDLLSHQTGLERLDTINQLSPAYPLRTKWQYNDWMYALVGEIIERQTTVIRSRIPADATARPYMITDGGEAVRIADVSLLDGTTMSPPGGGVRSSAHDMLIWAKALMAGFRRDPSPLHRVGNVLSGYAITNRSSGFDELYALGLAKVTSPTQFGKMGFNPNLVDVMPLIGQDHPPTSIFYHNGAMPGYNHCLVMIPGQQAAIAVLTNSISQGDIADWVAQIILQAVIGSNRPVDLVPIAEDAAKRWKTRYATMVETLEKGRTPNTEEPPHAALVGHYQHKNTRTTHTLKHYHHDTFCFLPSAEERIQRALFHYTAPTWLLHFEKREETGAVWSIKWKLGNQVTDGEIFKRVSESPSGST